MKPTLSIQGSEIHVKMKDNADSGRIAAQIITLRDELRVLPWEDYAGIVRSMTDSFAVIDAILNIVNMLVAGITIFIITYI